MKKTKKEYSKMVEKRSPNSRLGSNLLRAFLVGGLFSVLGQLITNLLKMKGLELEDVSAITSIIMVFIGASLTGLNIYDDIGRFAGAGSIVPITGFANSIVSPAMEFKSEGYVTGVGARMFVIAGPVLVYGISSSVIAGIIYYLVRM
jgi:stage V sporulation protein AC